jgi:hypothetical protein
VLAQAFADLLLVLRGTVVQSPVRLLLLFLRSAIRVAAGNPSWAHSLCCRLVV